MTRTKMLLLTLLLAPAAASAEILTVDWSGQIVAYAPSPGSSFPQTLTDTSVSGVFTFNTNLLAGITGTDLLQSSVQWSGGPFTPELPGSTGSNSVSVDTIGDVVFIQDSSLYTDSLGTQHEALVDLNVTGLLAATAAGTSDTNPGNGIFLDQTALGEGFQALFSTDSVTASLVSVPEPDTASLSVGMLLAVMVAWIRGRRKVVRPLST